VRWLAAQIAADLLRYDLIFGRLPEDDGGIALPWEEPSPGHGADIAA
jgi:hypothetical protein